MSRHGFLPSVSFHRMATYSSSAWPGLQDIVDGQIIGDEFDVCPSGHSTRQSHSIYT